MFYSVFSMVLAIIMGLFIGEDPPVETERLMVIIMGPGMLYLLVMMLYCIGRAIDLPKSEAKPLLRPLFYALQSSPTATTGAYSQK